MICGLSSPRISRKAWSVPCPDKSDRHAHEGPLASIGFAAVLALLLIFPPAAATGDVLVLRDIHFNPFTDKSLVDGLATTEPSQWASILTNGTVRTNGYGADTDSTLLHSALDAIAAQPKPNGVLISGDFLTHLVRAMFDASAIN